MNLFKQWFAKVFDREVKWSWMSKGIMLWALFVTIYTIIVFGSSSTGHGAIMVPFVFLNFYSLHTSRDCDHINKVLTEQEAELAEIESELALWERYIEGQNAVVEAELKEIEEMRRNYEEAP